MKTTTFKIEGMSCDSCAGTIKKLIEKEPGVQMVSVSFRNREARVLYDESIQEEHLIETIQKPGFRLVGRK